MLNRLNEPYRNGSGIITYKKVKLPSTIRDDFKTAANKEMCSQGEKEMYGIAKRFAAKFPEVLLHSYSNNNYSFVTTDKLRTAQSAVAFAHGLFEGK